MLNHNSLVDEKINAETYEHCWKCNKPMHFAGKTIEVFGKEEIVCSKCYKDYPYKEDYMDYIEDQTFKYKEA